MLSYLMNNEKDYLQKNSSTCMNKWCFVIMLVFLQVAFEENKNCSVSIGCYSDCGSGGCSYEVTWKDTGTKVEFTMKASIPSLSSTGNWIALGLSDDKHMVGVLDTYIICRIKTCGRMVIGFTISMCNQYK